MPAEKCSCEDGYLGVWSHAIQVVRMQVQEDTGTQAMGLAGMMANQRRSQQLQ